MRPLPFSIKARFDFFLVLLYAVDLQKAKELLAAPLVHEEHNGKGLMAVAFVKTTHFRPAFLPSWLGMSFTLTGFRHMASYRRTNGKMIRGLKIIRSFTDKKIMVKSGAGLSEYQFQYNPVTVRTEGSQIKIEGTGIKITAKESGGREIPLPDHSVFESWVYARKFAGPLLYTFEINKKEISITEGSRHHWQPVPVEIIEAETPFFDEAPYDKLEPVLSGAYLVKNIPYSWKKAVKEKYV